MADKVYIEREALKREIYDTTWYHTTTHGSVVIGAENESEALYIGKDVYDAIDRVPAADVVEVRHGEWVEQLDGTHYCSECGHDATYTFDGTEICGIGCPFCYAKMDGKGDGE